ncbi:MAG: peptide chain release factor N(5)-glutamine methyltransferase [Dehalococcoidia bacterium]|nr:peptide chain release factor N(5)-glutamine methyltransferase [Dehalococcoidia bacterium]
MPRTGHRNIRNQPRKASTPLGVHGMTLANAQHAAAKAFEVTGIDDALLEAEILLRHVLHLDRASYFAELNQPISEEEAEAYDQVVSRRLAREPSAYITGHREFFALDFRVTPDALIPRPETELLVEATRARIAGEDAPLIVDVGVGCGAIAVATAANQPNVTVIATDVSFPALALTRLNARLHNVDSRVACVQADLLSGLHGRFDVIVTNLPYVRTSDWETLEPEIREHEPRLALDGGPDGLSLIKRLLHQAAPFVEEGAEVYAEIGDDQGEEAIAHARTAMPWANVAVLPDLAGRDRMLVVKR